jgi:hypothetical protein
VEGRERGGRGEGEEGIERGRERRECREERGGRGEGERRRER